MAGFEPTCLEEINEIHDALDRSANLQASHHVLNDILKVDLNKVLFYHKKEKFVDRDVLIQLFGWTGASLPQKRTINRI